MMKFSRVLGFDPASSKASTIFNGEEFVSIDPNELPRWVSEPCDTLICWDAPLTGPAQMDALRYRGELYTRIIEKYFGGGVLRWNDGRIQRWESKVPKKGIAVRGYGGLSHWVISRRVLGLPRVGPWDASESQLPARLLTDAFETAPAPDAERPSVVEVHPALALWLWLRAEPEFAGRDAWNYKTDRVFRQACWEGLKRVLRPQFSRIPMLATGVDAADARCAVSDDHLDAFIAWALGILWVRQDSANPAVVLFGDHSTGTMLLPCCDMTDNRNAMAPQ
jgi:predicted RNase H-like nuclease